MGFWGSDLPIFLLSFQIYVKFFCILLIAFACFICERCARRRQMHRCRRQCPHQNYAERTKNISDICDRLYKIRDEIRMRDEFRNNLIECEHRIEQAGLAPGSVLVA